MCPLLGPIACLMEGRIVFPFFCLYFCVYVIWSGSTVIKIVEEEGKEGLQICGGSTYVAAASTKGYIWFCTFLVFTSGRCQLLVASKAHVHIWNTWQAEHKNSSFLFSVPTSEHNHTHHNSSYLLLLSHSGGFSVRGVHFWATHWYSCSMSWRCLVKKRRFLRNEVESETKFLYVAKRQRIAHLQAHARTFAKVAQMSVLTILVWQAYGELKALSFNARKCRLKLTRWNCLRIFGILNGIGTPN